MVFQLKVCCDVIICEVRSAEVAYWIVMVSNWTCALCIALCWESKETCQGLEEYMRVFDGSDTFFKISRQLNTKTVQKSNSPL